MLVSKLYFIVIRRHDLVKFVGPSACKYFTRHGSHDALVEEGTLGIVLSVPHFHEPELLYDDRGCEVLIGNEVYTAYLEDLSKIQSGEQHVV